jgi:flavin reductase (DIM6/NTAB) family NADH-FMN oxidoreductase RutF
MFPTGTVIVTKTTDGGERLGLTISSFNSVSLSPPLILFSIARSAYSIAAWMEAQHYTVNILHESQQEISTRFAKALGDKLSGLTPAAGERGAPLLPNALAALECVPYAQHDGGDHVIMVGHVKGIRRRMRPWSFTAGAIGGSSRSTARLTRPETRFGCMDGKAQRLM